MSTGICRLPFKHSCSSTKMCNHVCIKQTEVITQYDSELTHYVFAKYQIPA